MTASVSYTKNLQAAFTCSVGINKDPVSAGVGFNVSGNYSTSGSASKIATHRSHLNSCTRI